MPWHNLLTAIALLQAFPIVWASEINLIPKECLRKSLSFKQTAKVVTNFDSTEYIAANIHSDFTLFEYNACSTIDGNITSILLSYVDEKTTQKFNLERVGPRLTNCNTIKFSTKGFVSKIRVFKNSNSITGITLTFNGLLHQKIGRETTNYTDVAFEEGQQVMGFYGAQTTAFITELGFVVQDTSCTAKMEQALVAKEITQTAVQAQTINNEEDEQTKQAWIIAGSTGGCLVLAIIIFLFISWHIRKKQKLNQVGSAPHPSSLNEPKLPQNKSTNSVHETEQDEVNQMNTERPINSRQASAMQVTEDDDLKVKDFV